MRIRERALHATFIFEYHFCFVLHRFAGSRYHCQFVTRNIYRGIYIYFATIVFSRFLPRPPGFLSRYAVHLEIIDSLFTFLSSRLFHSVSSIVGRYCWWYDVQPGSVCFLFIFYPLLLGVVCVLPNDSAEIRILRSSQPFGVVRLYAVPVPAISDRI